MKVSFDFDGTLSRKDVQEFTKELVDKGFEVWVVTSRFSTETSLAKGWYWIEKQNQQLYNVAEECGIKKENIKFTEHVDKIEYLKDKGFAFHLDDDEWELLEIMKSKDNCQPVNVNHFEWKQSCLEVLNKI